MARTKESAVASIWNAVTSVAASLLPAAVLSLPVIRAAIEPGAPVLVFVLALHLLYWLLGLLLAWLFLFLFLILLALDLRRPLFLLLLGLDVLLLPFLLTSGPLRFFWTSGTGRLRTSIGRGLFRPPWRFLARGFHLLWLLSGIRRCLLPFRLGLLFLIGAP